MTKRFRIFKNILGSVLITLGLYLIADIYFPVNKAKYVRSDEELLTLTNYVSNDPYYHDGKGKRGKFFRLELHECPGITFENEDEFLKATSWESALKEIRYHDTVTIKVLKSKFERLYLYRDSLSFFDQIINVRDRFEFYSLRFKGKEYVSNLVQAAKEYKQEIAISRIMGGLVVIGMGAYCLLIKK